MRRNVFSNVTRRVLMKQIAVRNKRTTKYMIMYFVSGFQFWNCVFWSHFSINPFKFSNVSQLP